MYPFLHHDLIEYLKDYGISALQDAHNLSVGEHSYWLSAEDLELGGSWASCWNKYISSLENGGIKLKPMADKLLWTHNKKDGMVTAALVYDLMTKTLLEPSRDYFMVQIWHGLFPLKIKCFFLVGSF